MAAFATWSAGSRPVDWDVATSAHPEVVAALFPDSTWANPFGTVTVRSGDMAVEITTYRSEGGYRDRRHPDEVVWGSSLTDDLARRDFTINAMAWVPDDLEARRGHLVDPFGGTGGPGGGRSPRGGGPGGSDSPRTRCGSCAPRGSRRPWT